MNLVRDAAPVGAAQRGGRDGGEPAIANNPPSAAGGIAPLRNVILLTGMIERLTHRLPGEPGMGCFHGRAGLGKSYAKIFAANKHRTYHVQMRSVWTRRKLCEAILQDMGIKPAPSLADTVEQIGEQLALSRRPLIIDEADFLVQKRLIEILRDIYEYSQSVIILIGEEHLPQSLARWERVYSRIRDWVPAQPAGKADAAHLAALYCPGVEITPELLTALVHAAGGSARRIVVALGSIREQAIVTGRTRIGIDEFSGAFFPYDPPLAAARHRAVPLAAGTSPVQPFHRPAR